MLSISEVQEALGELLVVRFPGEQVYQNLTPAQFARPSFLVKCSQVKMIDAGMRTLDVTAAMTITAFVAVNETNNSPEENLAEKMMAVLELFAVGYLEVGGRSLHVTGNEGTHDFDSATVKVTLSYQDDRPGEDSFMTMNQVHTTIKEVKK